MSVEQLKAKRKQKKKQKKTFNNRFNVMNDVTWNIDNRLDDNISIINARIRTCSNQLKQGLEINGRISNVSQDIENSVIRYSGSDSQIVEIRNNIVGERNRCKQKMNKLDEEIRRLEQQIQEQGGTIYFWE